MGPTNDDQTQGGVVVPPVTDPNATPAPVVSEEPVVAPDPEMGQPEAPAMPEAPAPEGTDINGGGAPTV